MSKRVNSIVNDVTTMKNGVITRTIADDKGVVTRTSTDENGVRKTTIKNGTGASKTTTIQLSDDMKKKFFEKEKKRMKSNDKKLRANMTVDLKRFNTEFAKHGLPSLHAMQLQTKADLERFNGELSKLSLPSLHDWPFETKKLPKHVNASLFKLINETNAQKATPAKSKAGTPKKTTIGNGILKTPTIGKDPEKKPKSKTTALKKPTKGTADAKPATKLNAYSLFIKEYKPRTASLADKANDWKILTKDNKREKEKYARKAAAWNKKHELGDQATPKNANGDTETDTGYMKFKVQVFDEIMKAFNEAVDRENNSRVKMFKSITLEQSNFNYIRIDQDVQALFNDMVFAAQSIYKKATKNWVGRRRPRVVAGPM